MKLLPEPGWRRTAVLILITILLTLSSIICLYAYLLVNEPQIILRLNYETSFLYLNLTKKFILEKTVNGNSICFYSDSFDGKPIKIINKDSLSSVLKKACDDFENFIAQKHKLEKPGKKQRKRIRIIFVRPEIYKTFNLIRQGSQSEAFAQIFLRKIFIRIETEKNGKYDILEEENTLRHEIFHILSGEYNLSELLPHHDADEFGSLK
ncbi:MAG: hypothetical protein HYX21_00320 [Candidatus Yanofskybacteria bacterium]|nr:hypothetical protein [Candidatus Yanofskybacteria bacterium]